MLVERDHLCAWTYSPVRVSGSIREETKSDCLAGRRTVVRCNLSVFAVCCGELRTPRIRGGFALRPDSSPFYKVYCHFWRNNTTHYTRLSVVNSFVRSRGHLATDLRSSLSVIPLNPASASKSIASFFYI